MFVSRFARSTAIRRAFYTTEAPSGLSAGEKHIYEKLTEALTPHKLRVADVSGIKKHICLSHMYTISHGMLLFLGGCGSMYAIDIAAKKFEGTSIVKQHRMVNDVLKEEIKGMHGLQVN